MPRDWWLFNPPAELPQEEDSDLEEIFEHGFPYRMGNCTILGQ